LRQADGAVRRAPAPARPRSANFSGGNQQKLVLAREMRAHAKVLLVGQPTRGVDIGAIEFIHRELIRAAMRLRGAGGVGRTRGDPVACRPILVMFAGRSSARSSRPADERTSA
jgi:simple sugar transport system ATP-binding protein